MSDYKAYEDYDPFGAAMARQQGLTFEEYIAVNKLAAVFMRSTRQNLPSVEMEINSFRYDKVKKEVKYTGDMTYQGDNRWLDLVLPLPNGIENVQFLDLVKNYLIQVKNAYGVEVIKEAGLDALL